MMDRLKALEIFKAVVDNGSFVKGADALNLSKPATSRAIQDLEALLGAQLLQRTTRKIALTAFGHTVLMHAASLLESYGALEEASSMNSKEVAGDIRLIAPVSYGMRRLGPALASFMATYPKVRVDLHLADDGNAVLETSTDLALCVAGSLPPSVIARKVNSVAVGLFASPDYLARRDEPTHPLDLVDHDCLIHDAASGSQWTFVDPHLGEKVSVAVRGTLNSNNEDALIEAAVHGLGLVRLPLFYAEAALARGDLQQVLEDWNCPGQDLLLAYVSRQHQSVRVRKLIEHLASALGSPTPRPAAAVRSELRPGLGMKAPLRPELRSPRLMSERLAA